MDNSINYNWEVKRAYEGHRYYILSKDNGCNIYLCSDGLVRQVGIGDINLFYFDSQSAAFDAIKKYENGKGKANSMASGKSNESLVSKCLEIAVTPLLPPDLNPNYIGNVNWILDQIVRVLTGDEYENFVKKNTGATKYEVSTWEVGVKPVLKARVERLLDGSWAVKDKTTNKYLSCGWRTRREARESLRAIKPNV